MNTPEKHTYPSLVVEAEDEVSLARNKEALQEHMKKTKLNHEAIRELMNRTFYARRVAILDDPEPKSVQSIIEEYPMLRKNAFVSTRVPQPACV